jgi:hypothetical protein
MHVMGLLLLGENLTDEWFSKSKRGLSMKVIKMRVEMIALEVV